MELIRKMTATRKQRQDPLSRLGPRRGRLTLLGTIDVTGSCTQVKRGMLLILKGYASGLSNTVRCEGQRT